MEARLLAGYARSARMYHLKSLDAFCLARHPGEARLTKELVLGWLEKSERESAAGLKVRASFVRNFGGYLQSCGINAYVLMPKFVRAKSERKPLILSDEELAALFGAIDGSAHPAESHTSLIFPFMFRLIYTCELSPGEGCSLLLKDAWLDRGENMIRKAKCHKERLVRLSGDMLGLAKDYSRKMDAISPNREYLFPSSKSGGRFSGIDQARHLSACWRTANHETLKRFNVPVLRVNDFRHNFVFRRIYQWLEEGADVHNKMPRLQQYLGYASLDSTMWYLKLLPANLASSNAVDWSRHTAGIPDVKAVW
jgi:integrase